MKLPIKEWLWPNIPTFLTTVGVVFMMYLLFRKYLFKPMNKFLEKRSNYIIKKLKVAEQREEESEKILSKSKKEFDKKLQDADVYAQKFIDKAKLDSQQMIEKTKDEIVFLKKQMQEQIDLEAIKSRKKIYEEVLNISFEVSKKILENEINSKFHKKIIDDFIKEKRYD